MTLEGEYYKKKFLQKELVKKVAILMTLEGDINALESIVTFLDGIIPIQEENRF